MSIATSMRWVGMIGIVSVAVLRCLILFAPQVVFDTDPAMKDAMPLAGLGPAGSLLLDVLLLTCCAVALLGEWRSGNGLEPTTLVLALLPLPVVLWQGTYDAGDLWRGSTWAAAALACATIAHLARDHVMRTIIIAFLLAAVVPILARGFVQVTVEHAATVEAFEQSKEQFFRDKGWTADSSAAQIFERRLRDPQPLAWFTTTNIFASLAAFGFVLFAGLALAAWRARMESGWAGAMVLLAMASAAALVLTGSKGAIGAIVVGIALFVVLDFGNRKLNPHRETVELRREFTARRSATGVIVLGLLALTISGVVIRGWLLPEAFLGDKSLLFRWHYLVAAAPMFFDHFWWGVGADGFQEAYTLYRLPRNPEEVTSAHSVFVDWLCALGIVGLGWVVLIVRLIRCAKTESIDAGQASQTPGVITPAARTNVLAALSVCLLSVVAAIAIESPALDQFSVWVRMIGAIGFVVVAMLSTWILQHGERRTASLACVAAITVLLIHGQIEMTFHQPNAVVWAMCVVGLIGTVRADRHASMRNAFTAALLTPLMIMAAIWLTITAVLPAFQQQRTMVRAAETLRPIAQNPDDFGLMVQTRRSVSELLIAAYEIWPRDVRPLDAAVKQLELASSPNKAEGPQPLGTLMDALDLAQRSWREHDKSAALVSLVNLNARLAQATHDENYWNAAIGAATLLTQRDPNSLSAWRRLGDALWLSGSQLQASQAYRRALECDSNFALDELKRLSDYDRSVIRSRIAQTEENSQ